MILRYNFSRYGDCVVDLENRYSEVFVVWVEYLVIPFSGVAAIWLPCEIKLDVFSLIEIDNHTPEGRESISGSKVYVTGYIIESIRVAGACSFDNSSDPGELSLIEAR